MHVEILVALVCCAVTLLGVVYLGAQFFNSPPPPSQPQAKGIVWGGRTFVDLAEFSRWLRSQGVAYEVWALRHPTRAGIAPLRPSAVSKAKRAQPSGAGHSSNWTTVAGAAVVLAALFLLIGIRRRSWLPRMRGELSRDQLVFAAQRAAAAPAAGARLILRLTIATVRTSSRLATSLALVLVIAAQGVALAAAAGTRLMLRLATVAVRWSSRRARAGGWAAWRRRDTLAWFALAVLLATISALTVTLWA